MPSPNGRWGLMRHHTTFMMIWSPQMSPVLCVEKKMRNCSMFCYLNALEYVQMVRSLHVQCDIPWWWHYKMDALSPIVALCVVTITGRFPSQRVTLIARFMGPTWGPPGAESTWVGPMLAPWTLLSGQLCKTLVVSLLLACISFSSHDYLEKWGASIHHRSYT